MTQPQTIDSIDPATESDLQAKRDWVAGHWNDDSRHKYATIEGKLDLLEAILAGGWIASAETVKLQALGATFGDAIAQKLLMEWVLVEDEYGQTAALNWPGTKLLSFPLTMIAKRVEDGEAVDVRDLFEGVCERITQLAFSGDSV